MTLHVTVYKTNELDKNALHNKNRMNSKEWLFLTAKNHYLHQYSSAEAKNRIESGTDWVHIYQLSIAENVRSDNVLSKVSFRLARRKHFKLGKSWTDTDHWNRRILFYGSVQHAVWEHTRISLLKVLLSTTVRCHEGKFGSSSTFFQITMKWPFRIL